MSRRAAPKLKIETAGSTTTVSLGDRAVKIYQERPNKYRVIWNVGRERVRRAYTNPDDALEAAKDVLDQLAEGRAELTKTPAQKIEGFVLLEKAVHPATLEEVVRYYLDRRPKYFQPKTVREVLDELLETKGATVVRKGSSNRWVRTLKYRLGKFADCFACPINSIKAAEVEEFLLDPKHGWSERTRYNIQQTLMVLFNFARRKDYLDKGDTVMDQIERIGIPRTEPKVFRPDQLRSLLRAANADEKSRKLLPYIAIGAFAGLRSAEICRLNWEEHFDFEEGAIRLPSSVTKTKRRRTVVMNETLLQWLKPFKGATGKVVPYYNIHKFTLPLAVAAKVPWVPNGLRHSCISYGMALDPNAYHWAEQSGHSVTVLQTNYKQLVSKKGAELWFSSTPQALDAADCAESDSAPV